MGGGGGIACEKIKGRTEVRVDGDGIACPTPVKTRRIIS